MDVLAALASDPTVLPLWAVLAFAACMYPVGIMFSCRACCKCAYCTPPSELPDTVTVTFDGFVDEEQVPGPDLCHLSFSSTFGSGAAGKVTAPGGDPATAAGPIASLSLTSGGSGYARLARVEPTVSVGGGNGSGAELDVTLAEDEVGGLPVWRVESVAIAPGGDGGTGYMDVDQLSISIQAPGVEVSAAAITAHTTRSEPGLTVTPSGGSDAELAVTMSPFGSDPETWYISDVSVIDGGSGYPSEIYASIDPGVNGVEEGAAFLVFRTGRTAPTLELYGGTGTSASLSARVGSNGDTPETWGITSVTITDGGAGYEVGDLLSVSTAADDVADVPAYVFVDAIDGSGAITALSIYYGGQYWKNDGIIASVEIYSGGAYYANDGVIASVTVEDGGSYYEEDASLPPYVADVTVGVSQDAPSAGSGAVLTATIDDDPASANFGKIVSVAIDNGGDDYLAWQYVTAFRGCCGDFYNGRSVVCRRGLEGDPCKFVAYLCGTGSFYAEHGRVTVEHVGPGLSSIPRVTLQSEYRGPNSSDEGSTLCTTNFVGSGPITDCDQFEFVAESTTGVEATVEPGGDYDPAAGDPDHEGTGFPSCSVCCRGDSQMPSELTVSVVDNSGQGFTGTYVLEAEYYNPYIGAPGPMEAGYVQWKYITDKAYYPAVRVTLETVARQFKNAPWFPQEWPSTPPTTVKCHEKCVMRAYVGNHASWILDPNGDKLVTTPYCQPSGTFELRGGPFNTTPINQPAPITLTIQ